MIHSLRFYSFYHRIKGLQYSKQVRFVNKCSILIMDYYVERQNIKHLLTNHTCFEYQGFLEITIYDKILNCGCIMCFKKISQFFVIIFSLVRRRLETLIIIIFFGQKILLPPPTVSKKYFKKKLPPPPYSNCKIC